MNSVILIGRLTKDPELWYLAGSGKAVASFTLALYNAPQSQDRDGWRVRCCELRGWFLSGIWRGLIS